MTAKMTPAQLRQKAKELIEQAALEEAKRQQLIGKIVVELINKKFDGFDVELFMTQVSEIWTNGNVKRRPKTKNARTTATTDPKEEKKVA